MKLKLNKIRNTDDLARYLSTTPEFLNELSNPLIKNGFVHKLKIPKPGGNFREVVRIYNIPYRLILVTLLKYLNQLYISPTTVYGYVKEGGIKKNAFNHLHKKFILKFDIKNFFYNITLDQITNIFQSLGANESIAKVLSQITTYQEILYPGLNTSPILSNLYCQKMDVEFKKLSSSMGCTYTRYADDITISTDSILPDKKQLTSILEKYNFIINESKYKIMRMGRYQVVTGLSVFDKKCPRIPRNIKKKIRMACFLVKKNGSAFDSNVHWMSINKLCSLLAFYETIEPVFVKKMMKLMSD